MMLLSLQRCRNAKFDSFLGRPEFAENVYFSKDTLPVKVFDNILEASMDALCIKIMRFSGFLRVQIHSWNSNIS